MPAPTVAHPTDQMLIAYGLGKMDAAAAEGVLKHLEGCEACKRRVAELSADSFEEKFRAGHEPGQSGSGYTGLSAAVRAMPKTPVAPPAVPAELLELKQYTVIKELGRGGMGVVYLAKNNDMDRLEVLKVMQPPPADRAGRVATDQARFVREIQSAAKLLHPNVVTAYTVHRPGNLLVFAMEYAPGRDLAQVVKDSKRPLPVMTACSYVLAAANGLQHAHERGMVHRDIKPGNLILTKSGTKATVKVLDFGLAKVAAEVQPGHDLTGDGKMMGTPAYMAPEQAMDAASADIRADVYSLGCTLYYLLTGRPPFEGGSIFAVIDAHRSQQARSLNLVRPDVPVELAAVVAKMMAKEPGKRYQTPADVIRELRPFATGTAKPAAPSESVASSQANTSRPDQTAPEQPAPAVEPARTVVVPAPVAEAKLGRGRLWTWLAVGLMLNLLGGALLYGIVFKTPHGTIYIDGMPDGAVVKLDGSTATVTSKEGERVTLTAVQGKHTLEVEQNGVKMKVEGGAEVTLAGQPLKVRVESLTPPPQPATPPNNASPPNAAPKQQARSGEPTPEWVLSQTPEADLPLVKECLAKLRDNPARYFWVVANPYQTTVFRSTARWYNSPPVGRNPELQTVPDQPLHKPGEQSDTQLVVRLTALCERHNREVRAANPPKLVQLFNGKDLSGWKTGPSTAGWSVEGGVLVHRNGQGGQLLSTDREDFTDFRLTVEAMVSGAVDSGVVIRRGGDAKGYEVELNNMPDSDIRLGSVRKYGDRNIFSRVSGRLVKPGEWFQMEVQAVGGHLRVLVNSSEVVDKTDRTDPYLYGGFALFPPSGTGPRALSIRKLEVEEWAPAKPSVPGKPQTSPQEVSPDTGFAVGTVWVGKVTQLKKEYPDQPSEYDCSLTILKREGERFQGRWERRRPEKQIGVGVVNGVVTGNAIRWNAKDTTNVEGQTGFNVAGKLDGEELTLASLDRLEDGRPVQAAVLRMANSGPARSAAQPPEVTAPPATSDTRTRWVLSKPSSDKVTSSLFRQVGPTTWAEVNSGPDMDAMYLFRETSRSDEVVELQRSVRAGGPTVIVRLFGDRAEFGAKGQASRRTENGGWKPLTAKVANAKPFDWTLGQDDFASWLVESAAGVEVGDGVLTLTGRSGNALLTRRVDWADCTSETTMAADKGADGMVVIRATKLSGWRALASRIYDDAGQIKAGMQSNLELVERGMKRVDMGYGEPFTVSSSITGDTLWVSVNGTKTSGVRYNGKRFCPTSGAVGMAVTAGKFSLYDFMVQRQKP